MPPAFFPVEPEPSRSRSRTRTSRTPFFVRWYAIEAPMIPPPTMTTSGVRRIVAMVCSRRGPCSLELFSHAEVAELADAIGSGPIARKGLGGQIPPSAQTPLFVYATSLHYYRLLSRQ